MKRATSRASGGIRTAVVVARRARPRSATCKRRSRVSDGTLRSKPTKRIPRQTIQRWNVAGDNAHCAESPARGGTLNSPGSSPQGKAGVGNAEQKEVPEKAMGVECRAYGTASQSHRRRTNEGVQNRQRNPAATSSPKRDSLCFCATATRLLFFLDANPALAPTGLQTGLFRVPPLTRLSSQLNYDS